MEALIGQSDSGASIVIAEHHPMVNPRSELDPGGTRDPQRGWEEEEEESSWLNPV